MYKNRKSKKKRTHIQKNNGIKYDSNKGVFWASIISALIVTSGTIYSVILNKTNVVEYIEYPVSEWDIENATSYFPLELDYYWEYKGVLKTTSNNYEKYEREINLKIKVEEKTTNNDIALYGISNAIEEIPFFDYYFEEKDRSTLKLNIGISGYLLVANEIYLVPPDLYDKVKKSINESKNKEDGFLKLDLTQLEILYRMPLFKGQRFGELDQITRSDFAYFWYVNDFNEYTMTKNSKLVKVKNYEIIKQGVGFYEVKRFTPELGMTRYEFDNQRVKVELNLMKYKIKD